MKHSLNWRARKALASRLRLRDELAIRAAKFSPAAFRRELLVNHDVPLPFGALIQPWQQQDFGALDPAWLRLAGQSAAGGFQRAYIERPRGHAKTSDMALQVAWILLYSPHRVQGLAAAADQEQAALIRSAVQHLARINPRFCQELQFRQNAVINPRTDSQLDILSSDVQSSWGVLPDFVICDELCHWEKPEFWHSLFSSAAKRPGCVLAVLTNAGVGREWQWEVRESARNSPDWYFSSLDGAQAPWISSKALQEQKLLLPAAVYERLWENRWQHSDGGFVTLEEAEACRDENLTFQKRGQPNRNYFAAIDYAEKHDYTVGVLVHRDGSRIVVDRMDVVTPQPDKPVPVKWVEEWIRQMASAFHSVVFVIDEYQLLGTIQKLESLYDIGRFEFSAGKGNHALALLLRQLIIHREVAWYPDCGRIKTDAGRDDLETELASLILKQSPNGRCRIDHRRNGKHHDDRAFALGAACLYAMNREHESEWLEITPPAPGGQFSW